MNHTGEPHRHADGRSKNLWMAYTCRYCGSADEAIYPSVAAATQVCMRCDVRCPSTGDQGGHSPEYATHGECAWCQRPNPLHKWGRAKLTGS